MRYRVLYEPGAVLPWLVQTGPARGEHWLDWRRFSDEEDARKLAIVLGLDAKRRSS